MIHPFIGSSKNIILKCLILIVVSFLDEQNAHEAIISQKIKFITFANAKFVQITQKTLSSKIDSQCIQIESMHYLYLCGYKTFRSGIQKLSIHFTRLNISAWEFWSRKLIKYLPNHTQSPHHLVLTLSVRLANVLHS